MSVMAKTNQILSLGIKILILIAIVAVGIIIYQSCAGTAIIQRIDRTLPDTTIAPYEVSTRTHIYQAEWARENEDGSATMTNWYTKLNGKWQLQKNTLPIPAVLRPQVRKR